MNKPLDIFCEIPCLTEKSVLLNGLILQKKWFKSADKRIIGHYLQKFITYNHTSFQFLGVTPYIVGSDSSTSLYFHTTQYIGAIPLRASDTGKQIGDLIIIPRFIGRNKFEDYIAILDLLGNDISPQFADTLNLASGRIFRPPLYLEGIKFVNSLISLLKTRWQKFDRVEKISLEPTGNINWKRYVQYEYKVENKLRFPIVTNVLNEFHNEYSQIRYVYDMVREELLSVNTPHKVKVAVLSKLNFINERLYTLAPLRTHFIKIKSADNPIVSCCKSQANKILQFNLIDCTAWRVDFSEVFEKYIQFIFHAVAKETGGRLQKNLKFNSLSKKRNAWELNHVEPDAIFQKDELLIFIDAKYKSHLYNKFEKSESLKNEHRHDLHQIMAYTSFSQSQKKYGVLCYPSNEVELKNVVYTNPLNQVQSNIKILGIPLKVDCINAAKRLIINEILLIT